jgi:Holliday junction resolvase RusA-like endonuclease
MRFHSAPGIIAQVATGSRSTERAAKRGRTSTERSGSFGCSADSSLGILQFTILGRLASKGNSRELVNLEGRKQFIKSPRALQFLKDFGWQCPKGVTYIGPVSLSCWVFYDSWKPDLEIDLVKDCLQRNHVLQNDRQVIEQHAYRGLDKKNPRVVVRIEPRDQWVSATSTNG